MARNTKRIAHDLIPLSDAVSELSSLISEFLSAIKPHARFENPKAPKYFDDFAQATIKLAISARLIRKYIQEVDNEADREGIIKD
jgi:hypothetical protein